MVYTIPAKRNERAQSTDRVFYPSGGYGRTTFKVFIYIGFLVFWFGPVFSRRGSVLNVPPEPQGLGARSPHLL